MIKKILSICGVSSLLLVASCGNSHTEQSVLVATDYQKQTSRYAKPGAAIALTNSKVTLDVAGAQYTVNVDIDSAYTNGQMNLSVSTSEGLYIVGGDTNPSMSLHQGTINCPYTVMASEPGRYYIYVNAKVDNGGNIQSRALTFIVQVGEETKNDSVSLEKTQTDGQTDYVIPMQAKEEIINE